MVFLIVGALAVIGGILWVCFILRWSRKEEVQDTRKSALNDNPSLGKASLWSAIIGVVLPGCLAAIVAAFPQRLEEKGLAFGICGFLFVVLELVGHGCGIAARRTATGKAGLVISGVLLPVALGLLALFFG